MCCVSKSWPFWIYTIVSFFKTFFPLCVCVLKILNILKKKKNCTQTLSLNFGPLNNILGHYKISYNSFKIRKFVERNCKTLYICVYNLSFLITTLKIISGTATKHSRCNSFYNLKTFSLLLWWLYEALNTYWNPSAWIPKRFS